MDGMEELLEMGFSEEEARDILEAEERELEMIKNIIYGG